MLFRKHDLNSVGRINSIFHSILTPPAFFTMRLSPPRAPRPPTSAACAVRTFAACASPKTFDDTRQKRGSMKPQRSSKGFRRKLRSFKKPARKFTPGRDQIFDSNSHRDLL